MNHVLPDTNWVAILATTIEVAASGDTIVCCTLAQAELGERARQRMHPEKTLHFDVRPE